MIDIEVVKIYNSNYIGQNKYIKSKGNPINVRLILNSFIQTQFIYINMINI